MTAACFIVVSRDVLNLQAILGISIITLLGIMMHDRYCKISKHQSRSFKTLGELRTRTLMWHWNCPWTCDWEHVSRGDDHIFGRKFLTFYQNVTDGTVSSTIMTGLTESDHITMSVIILWNLALPTLNSSVVDEKWSRGNPVAEVNHLRRRYLLMCCWIVSTHEREIS